MKKQERLSSSTGFSEHVLEIPRDDSRKEKDEYGTKFKKHISSPYKETSSLFALLIISTSLISSFLFFVALLVSGGLGLIRTALLIRQSLPALTKNLADLPEGYTGVLGADILALLVGEEHVGREATLGRVRVLLLALVLPLLISDLGHDVGVCGRFEKW